MEWRWEEGGGWSSGGGSGSMPGGELRIRRRRMRSEARIWRLEGGG